MNMGTAAAGALQIPLERWGRVVIAAAVSFGIVVVLSTAWFAPDLIILLPALPAAVLAAVVLNRYPLANLCVLLLGFIIISDYQEGIQVTEALYGLYYMSFIAYWLVTRLFFYRDPVLRPIESKAVFLFLIGITASIPITVVFGGSLRLVLSEWTALVMLGLYFPIREACVRFRNALPVILAAVLLIVVFIAIRNLTNYQSIIVAATQAWQVTKGRLVVNDSILMVGSLGSLVYLIHARAKAVQAALVMSFLVALPALVLTQSRAFWLAFTFGCIILFLIAEPPERRRLLVAGTLGAAIATAIGLFFFGDIVELIFAGLLDRFASLRSAATTDISLVNRFRETAVVFDHIKWNPVLGHGMGVRYAFFDLSFMSTRYDSFIHNGFVSLWFKFGLWGLALMVVFWIVSVRRGVEAFWRSGPRLARVTGLAAALCLLVYLLPANTSNPFFLDDATFIIAVLTGLACGASDLTRLHAEERHEQASSGP